MSATTPEDKVKAKIDKVLKPYKRRGVLEYNKTAGSMFGANGWPDYDGVMLGFFWSIEAKSVKQRKKVPTEIQQARINNIKKAGGIALVVNETNVDKLDAFFQRLEQRALKLMELLRANP